MIQQFILNGLIAGGIYALVALGFTVIFRTVKFFHLAHGVVYTTGAYIGYTLAIQLKLPIVIAFLFAMLSAAILGILIDRIVYRPLRKKKASNLILLLASFGIFIFVQNLIQLIYGAQILSLRTGPVKEGYEIFSAIITPIQIIILVTSFVLMITLWIFIRKTKLGKAMRAVSDDPMAANIVGINPERIIMISFALGSALAGAAGFLIGMETNLEPTMGFNIILKAIIASIVGGVGSIPGAMLGGLFIGLSENIGIAWLPSAWKDVIVFVILIIFLLIRPQGFLGIKTKKENS
ncbi:MAG: branched-chain amino acid ABC transporter permease [Sedimentisphaerales bacterium]|nr:branched-chain amino acid ABC transporter permease [Sedimentisphaerales bacterium]